MSAFGPVMPAFAELDFDVRRLLAPNPSMMTGPGTNTYLIGNEAIAVIDPGPAIAAHVDEIVEKSKGKLRWIAVTHTHPDHSPAVRLLAAATGAEVVGMRAPRGRHQDRTFSPDRVLADGDVLETKEFCLQAVHTPGHASNHLCYLLRQKNWLFTGDHIIDGSTVVIDPPDGNMRDYIASLRRCRALDVAALAPGHGELIHDARRAIDWIIEHRLQREAKVLAAMRANPGLTAQQLVPYVYPEIDPKLHALAERSLLAHVLKLNEEGQSS